MAGFDRSLLLQEESFSQDAKRILSFLEKQGTFRFPTLESGLFSAAAGEGDDFELTGYHSVWVRDNVHIAHAHLKWGERAKGEAAIKSLMTYFQKHGHRFVDVIEGRSPYADPMQRPHIRFDGRRLAELDEKWSHAQNDALGAFLWLASQIVLSGDRLTENDHVLLSQFPRLFQTIQYWQDEDSGHWEEVRKIAASSIGVAVAGLQEYRKVLAEENSANRAPIRDALTMDQIDRLIDLGRQSLNQILPAECLQSDPSQRRLYDSALLFLIYPYRVVTGEMADRIVANVTTHLMGDHGIRRYLGDSYWCADYKQMLAADERTADFSDNLEERDRLLQPGMEAQWCLFDPIVSIHYGMRFARSGEQEDYRRQIRHLQRSLYQLTRSDSRFGPYKCPESYYCEQGKYVSNDICPLLWTQANLKLALRFASGQSI